MTLRSVSYGGGVQSTALLVLAAQRRIDFPLFLMANVGDDSESKDSLAYVRDVAVPYAAAHGIELVILDRVRRDGTVETLRGRLMREGSRSIPIPMRMGGSGAPGNRSCTADFKIAVVGKELCRRGATVADPATVAIGISVDEIQRAKPGTDPRMPYQDRVYPLLDLGMHRTDCARIIADAGLPVPPKSSCYFCPYHDTEAWRDLKRRRPDDFADACHIEDTLNERRAAISCHTSGVPAVDITARLDVDPDAELYDDDEDEFYFADDAPMVEVRTGRCPDCSRLLELLPGDLVPPHVKDSIWMHRALIPLRDAIDDQEQLPGLGDDCDSGWCFT